MTNKELQQQIEQLEQQIKDLKLKLEEERFLPYVPYEVEVPEDIGNYYYVDEVGKIALVVNIFHDTDYKDLYQRGLTFKTEEEVKQYDKERILLFKMHKWAEEQNGDWTPNWDDFEEKQYHVVYDYEDKQFYVRYEHYSETFTKLPYLKSYNLADQFIEVFGEEIKEVLC